MNHGKDRQVGRDPSPPDIWRALGICAVCGGEVEFDPSFFKVGPPYSWAKESGGPRLTVPGRVIFGALYYRDPLHHKGRPFVNYCGPVCSNAG